MHEHSGEFFDRGLDFLTAVAARLHSHDWELATPCAGWTALDVLGHLGTTVGYATSVMVDRAPDWPDVDRPGELVDGEPIEFWRRTAVLARDALTTADLGRAMATPLGGTVADDIAIPVIDLYVHAWDLGTTIGVDVEIPAGLIDYAHSYIDPLPEDAVRGPDQAFAAAVPIAASASPTARFIAWTGRA